MESKIEIILKCKKCRRTLVSNEKTQFLTSHATPITDISHFYRPTDCAESVDAIYLDDKTLPDWVKHQIDQADWVKGKVVCECSSRLGSFDFVSGRKCSCRQSVLPAVHLVRNKVDSSAIT